MRQSFNICYRAGGVFWRSGDRERQITNRQAARLMSLVWTDGWLVEIVDTMWRETGETVSHWSRDTKGEIDGQ